MIRRLASWWRRRRAERFVGYGREGILRRSWEQHDRRGIDVPQGKRRLP